MKLTLSKSIFSLILIFVVCGSLPLLASDEMVNEYLSRNKQLVSDYDRLLPMAENSSGDIRMLMQGRLAKLEQSIIINLDQLVAEIAEQGLGDDSMHKAREAVSDWLTEHTPVIINRVTEQDQKVRALLLEIAPEDPPAALALEIRLRRELSQLLDWYTVLRGLSKNMETMGLEAVRVNTYLLKHLPELAELLASGVMLALERIDDARFGLSLMPKDERLRQLLTVVELQLDNSAVTLRRAADLLDELGQPAVDYRSLIIQVTGQISSDVFSLSVLQALFSQWAYDFRNWVEINGPNVMFKALLFVLITAVAYLLSRLTRGFVSRGVQRLQLPRLLKNLIESFAANTVLVLGVLIALSQMGVSLGPLLTGLGVVGFIVGFALQETLGNFASGMMILMYRPFDEDDVVEVAGVLGQIQRMSLVSTIILTPDNQELVIPNSKIWGNVIRNVNAQKQRRVDLEFSISYKDDLREVEALFRDVLAKHEAVLDDPKPAVNVLSLADSAVIFAVRPWVSSANYWDTYWDLNREVKLRLTEAGINIPYPQRDVHLFDERS